MNVPSRLVLFLLAGVAAALLTVFLTDVVRLIPIPDKITNLTAADARQNVLGIVAFGSFLSTLLAVADNLAQGRRDWLRVIGIGLGVGIAASFVGANFGMGVMAPLYKVGASNPAQFLGNVLARGLAWMTLGAFIGTVDGIRKGSIASGRNGVIGGLIGGFTGGILFECTPYLPGLGSGATSRLIGFATTGGLIGLFIALVQQLFREAWIRVVLGRNEGKEFFVEKPHSVLGRGELCEIPIYGDPSVAKKHAVLERGPGGAWSVADTGESPAGVLVNDQRIGSPTALRSGDRIQLGSKLLVFYEKQVRTPTVVERKEAPRAAPIPAPTAMPAAPPTTTWATAPAAPRAARLVVVSGPHAGATFPLQSALVAGRDPAASLPLPSDTKASRRHAQFVPDGAGWAVEDLGSTNGTFVNGQRITRLSLASGDTILIGQTALRLDA